MDIIHKNISAGTVAESLDKFLNEDFSEEDCIDNDKENEVKDGLKFYSNASQEYSFQDFLKSEPDKYEFMNFIHSKFESKNNNDLANLLVHWKCPLPYILYLENKDLIVKVLNLDAPIHTRIEGDVTALHLAAHFADLDIIKLLIYRGADITAKDERKKTPLSWFLQSKAVACDEAKEIINLLGNPELLVTEDAHGIFPLFVVMALGNESTIEEILQMDLNFNIVDKWGRSFLFFLITNKNLKTFTVLENHKNLKYNIDQQDENKESVLHQASRTGKVAAVQFLINQKADLTLHDKYGMTALQSVLEEYEKSPEQNLKGCIDLLKNGAEHFVPAAK